MADLVGRRALPSPGDDAETPMGHGSAGRRALPPLPARGWAPEDDDPTDAAPSGSHDSRAAGPGEEPDDEPTGRFALIEQPRGRFALGPPQADAPPPGLPARSAGPSQRGRFAHDGDSGDYSDVPFTDDQPTGRFAAIAPETELDQPQPEIPWTPTAPARSQNGDEGPAQAVQQGTTGAANGAAASLHADAETDPVTQPVAAEPEQKGWLEDGRRRLLAVSITALAVALVVTFIFVAIGGNQNIAAPGAQPSSPTAPLASATGSPGATPEESQTPSIDGDPWPVGPGLPAESADPNQSSSPAPSASTSAEPVVLDLGTAQVPVLPGWQLYADEKVQDDRRLIRIRNLATDTRIQIVALPGVTGSLTDACTDLVNDHRASYSGVALSMAVTVPVGSGAEGIACSFSGTRTSDNVETRVDFTVVRRETDATSLIFRDTIPQSVPGDSPARSELVRIECAAADSFGVTISQCAVATPGQVGG